MFNVDKITQKLKEKKITQRKFYEDLKLPNNSLSKWKKQNSIPSALKCYNIAKYLGCRIEDLLDLPYLE